jgi:hypothetical protein
VLSFIFLLLVFIIFIIFVVITVISPEYGVWSENWI